MLGDLGWHMACANTSTERGMVKEVNEVKFVYQSQLGLDLFETCHWDMAPGRDQHTLSGPSFM